MGALRSIRVDTRRRARRWDAIVLGTGVASLVTAARLGMHELRVLVVEEPAAAKLHGLLKELDDKPAPAHWRVGAWHAEAPKDAPPDEAPAAPEETPARDPEAAAA